MYMFKHRPFMLGCVISIATLIVSYALPQSLRLFVYIPILLALIMLTTILSKKDLSLFGKFTGKIYITICVMALLMATSFNIYQSFYISPIKDNYTNGINTAEINGYVADDGIAVIYGFKNTPMPYKATLNLTSPCEISPYTEFIFKGEILDPEEYYPDQKEYYAAYNITAVCEGEIASTSKSIRSVGKLFYTIRSYSVDCIEKYCGDQEGFISGLLLSADGKMPAAVYTDFKQTGTTHLCAVSGMHLVAIMAIFDLIFSKLVPSERFGTITAMIICIIYIFISGASMSVIRAGIMYLMCRSTFFTHADYDSLTALSVSAYLGFLIFPYSLYDVGFVLSLAATAGLLIFAIPAVRIFNGFLATHPFPKLLRIYLSTVVLSLIYSISCTFVIVPFLAVYYGSFCPLSVITTMLMTLPTTAVLYLSPMCIIFSFSPAIAGFFGTLSEAFARLSVDIIDFCAEHFTLSVSLSMPFIPYLTVIMIVCFIFFLVKKGTRRDFVIFSLCFTLIFTSSYGAYMFSRKDINRLTVFSEGDGEMVCVISDNKAIILDSTDGNSFKTLYEITERLTQMGITETQYAITSCGYMHTYYIGRLPRIINTEKLYISSPVIGNQDHTVSVLISAETDNIDTNILDPKDSTVINVGNIPITVFPQVYDGKKYQTIYAVGENFDYIYCPTPSHRISTAVTRLMTENTTVIYGTCKLPSGFNYFPVNDAYNAYIPISLAENGFSLYNEKTSAQYFENDFSAELN